MLRRALPSIVVVPLVAGSVLLGHTLAYALTGTDPGEAHAYLEHAPQVVLLALLAAFAVTALGAGPAGAGVRRRVPFAVLGIVTFAVQEHLEQLAHTGQVPFLLTDRTFLLGVLLQVPVGLLAVHVARRLLVVLDAARPGRPRPVPAVVLLVLRGGSSRRPPVGRRVVVARGRAPPALLGL